MAFKRIVTLRASFRFPAIRFDAPTLLSFSGFTHAHAKCPPVGQVYCHAGMFFFIFQMEETMSSKSIAGLAGGIVMRAGYFLPSENSLHSATPPLLSPRNDLWGMSAEMPYWWRVAIQIWVVLLIGRVNLLQPVRSTTPIALVSQTSFRGETSGGVAKCRLFSWPRRSQLDLLPNFSNFSRPPRQKQHQSSAYCAS